MLYATRPGMGLYSDSTYYLSVARRLLAGHGFTLLDIHRNVDPNTIFPFVYPTLLALPGLFRFDLLVGARWLGAFFLFLNVLLMGTIVYRQSRQSLGAAGMAALLGCTSSDIFSNHTLVLSDAASLTFVLLAFLLILNYLEKPSLGPFLGATLATALAFATRYAAAAFVIAGFAAILLWEKRPFARRLLNAVLFGLAGSSLMVLWVLRNMRYGGDATGRTLGFHLVMGMAQIKEILYALSTWASNGNLAPAGVPVRAALVAAVSLVVLVAAARVAVSKQGIDLRPAVPLLYIITYAAVLLLTTTFLQAELFDDGTNLARILLPLHAFVIILAVQMGARLYQRVESGKLRAAGSVLGAALAVCFLVWAIQWARAAHEDGQGFASSTYADSAMLRAIRGLPGDARFYSNLPWPIGIYTDRLWELLPTGIDDTTAADNTEYRSQMTEFAQTLHEHDVYLAYFKDGDDWFAFPSLEDMQAFVPLRAVAETPEGTIYAAAEK